MKRRHLRPVMRIEDQVYPRPWSLGRLPRRARRQGRVAPATSWPRSDGAVVGYAGLLYQLDDAHVTNVAVDPARHRHKIGTRLLLTLARQARAAGSKNITLEVRVSNTGAQAMYQRFGFAPVGMRQTLLRERRGRHRDVGPRHRHARVRRAASTPSRRRCPGRTTWDGPGVSDRSSRSAPDTVVLGIETSCDETAAAVRDGRRATCCRRWCRARSTCTPSSAGSCPRSPAGPTSS